MEGRPWVFKTPCDKPLALPEVKFCNRCIEIQTHFIKESNCHSMWDTTGETNLKTKKFPRLTFVTYAAAEWLIQGDWTPNQLRVWLEEMVRNDAKFQKDDWELLFDFVLDLINLYLLLTVVSLFSEYISSTKIRNKTVEVPFEISGEY